MDAVTLLEHDHRETSSLIQSIKAQLGKEKVSPLETFAQLKHSLEMHARVEELHVYQVFQQSEVTRDSAAQALEDHRRIKTLLDELATFPSADFGWVQKFNDLVAAVERHIQMEELELLGQADQVMTHEEREELGDLVQTAKKELEGKAPLPAGGIPS